MKIFIDNLREKNYYIHILRKGGEKNGMVKHYLSWLRRFTNDGRGCHGRGCGSRL